MDNNNNNKYLYTSIDNNDNNNYNVNHNTLSYYYNYNNRTVNYKYYNNYIIKYNNIKHCDVDNKNNNSSNFGPEEPNSIFTTAILIPANSWCPSEPIARYLVPSL